MNALRDLVTIWTVPETFATDAGARGRGLADWSIVVGLAILLACAFTYASSLTGMSAAVDGAMGGEPWPLNSELKLTLVAAALVALLLLLLFLVTPPLVRWLGGKSISWHAAAVMIYAWVALVILPSVVEVVVTAGLGFVLPDAAKTWLYLGLAVVTTGLSILWAMRVARQLFGFDRAGGGKFIFAQLAVLGVFIAIGAFGLVVLVDHFDLPLLTDLLV